MSFNYAPLKSSGTALIKKFGQELTFTRAQPKARTTLEQAQPQTLRQHLRNTLVYSIMRIEILVITR